MGLLIWIALFRPLSAKLAAFSSKVATFELEVASFASILASFSSSCDKTCDKTCDKAGDKLGTSWGQAGDITAIFTANITAIFTAIICCIAWGYTVGETYLVSRHINIGAIETVSQYKLNYDFTFKVFDHENTVLTLKKCQYWQKFNVGVILLVNTSNISNMSNKHKKLLKTQIKK